MTDVRIFWMFFGMGLFYAALAVVSGLRAHQSGRQIAIAAVREGWLCFLALGFVLPPSSVGAWAAYATGTLLFLWALWSYYDAWRRSRGVTRS